MKEREYDNHVSEKERYLFERGSMTRNTRTVTERKSLYLRK